VPTISHLLSIPIYLFEPMRIMLILALAHTTHRNAYLLALTLPIFSMVVSGHPVFLKTILITAELVLNVWLFIFLSGKVKNAFVAMVGSIIASKLFYYGIKFLLLSAVLLEGSLVSTPLYLQGITTIILSGYILLAFYLNRKPSSERK